MNLRRKNKVSAEFSMASMTDIIFLLLIFFMITSSAISQSSIEVKLPQTTDGNVNNQKPTMVTIRADGKYFIGDKEVGKDNLENRPLAERKNQHLPYEQTKIPSIKM